MALNKDQLGSIDERNLARAPSQRYVSAPLADAVESFGGTAIRLHQGKVTRNLEQSVEAEVEATTRLQQLGQEGYEDPSELFSGMTDRGRAKLESTLAQLESESIAVDDVINQRPALVGIARARLGKLVDETLARYPGYEREIMSKVSNLGFDPRGWAAKRILGLEGDEGQKLTQMDEIKWAAVRDRTLKLAANGYVDPSFFPSNATADQMLEITNILSSDLLAIEGAITTSKGVEANAKTGQFYGAKIVRKTTEAFTNKALLQAKQVIGKVIGANAMNLTDEQLAAQAQQALVSMEELVANYTPAAMAVIKQQGGDGLLNFIPDEVFDEGRKQLERNLAGFRALITNQDYLKQLRGNQEASFLLTQNDIFQKFPSIFNVAALYALPSIETAFEKTGFGARLMNAHVEVLEPYMGAKVTPAQAWMDTLGVSGNMVEIYQTGGEKALVRHVNELDKDGAKRAVTSAGATTMAGLDAIKNGNQPNPDAAVDAMLATVLATNQIEETGVRRPLQDQVALVAEFTAPEVYDRLSPETKLKVSTAHADVVTRAKQEVEDKYVLPLKDKAPKIAWVDGTTASPSEDGHYPDSLTFRVLTNDMAQARLVAVTDENAVQAAEQYNRTLSAGSSSRANTPAQKIATGRMLLNQWNQYATAKANMYNTYVLPLVKEEVRFRNGYKTK